MSDRLVTLADVALGYDGRRILEHVSFAVERGEFIALLGPNGGGKTTLLRGILRLVPVLAGDIAYGFDRPLPQPQFMWPSTPQKASNVFAKMLAGNPAIRYFLRFSSPVSKKVR